MISSFFLVHFIKLLKCSGLIAATSTEYVNVLVVWTGGGPIVGHQYVALLEKYKPSMTWDEGFEEHYFLYDGEDAKHVVFYPTLTSISARLNTANNVGAGISIWEIGQGLEYFFDLL